MRQINMNDMARVRLTPLGEKIWCDYWRPFSDQSEKELISSKTTADGWFRVPLWELARVFGPHFHNGADPPFGMNILVDVD